MDAEKLFEKIQTGSGKNPTDIAHILDALITSQLEKIKAGDRADFAGLGSFGLSETGRLTFTPEPEFERLINFRYNGYGPVVLEAESSPAAIPQVLSEPESAGDSSEEIEATVTESPEIISFSDSETESGLLTAENLVIAENLVTEEPGISFTEINEPSDVLSEPEQIFLSEPGSSEVLPQEPAATELPESEPAEVPDPLQDFVPAPASEFEEKQPEPAPVSESELPVFSQEEIPVPVSEPAPEPAAEPTAPAPPEPQPFTWTEPGPDISIAPASKEPLPAAPPTDGNTYQYQYLSHTELGKEMDRGWIWFLIAVGVIALGGFIYWFMKNDVAEVKKVKQATPVNAVQVDTAKKTVPVLPDSVKKDSITVKLPVPAATAVPVGSSPVAAPSESKKPAEAQPSKVVAPVKPAGDQKVKEAPAVKPAATETKPKQEPAKASAPATVTSAGLKGTYDEAKGGFTFNVASVPSKDQAEKQVKSWQSKGYASGLKEAQVNGKTLYRIRVGQFASRPEALKALEEFKSVVKDAWVDKIK